MSETVEARVAKLEAALKAIIEREEAFYNSCDYIYDEMDQYRADGKSMAYADCAEIAREALQ